MSPEKHFRLSCTPEAAKGDAGSGNEIVDFSAVQYFPHQGTRSYEHLFPCSREFPECVSAYCGPWARKKKSKNEGDLQSFFGSPGLELYMEVASR